MGESRPKIAMLDFLKRNIVLKLNQEKIQPVLNCVIEQKQNQNSRQAFEVHFGRLGNNGMDELQRQSSKN